MNPNPFKPTAGKRPPILIGRESVIEDFEEGLDNGAGAPGRLMLITGNRGCGKTVLLRELQRLANERGWAVVSDSASYPRRAGYSGWWQQAAPTSSDPSR